MRNMSVEIAGVKLKNPVMTASGTFGSGAEFMDYIDLSLLGGLTTKGVSDVPWKGNPTPRVAETASGMLNAIGLQNPGVDIFIKRDLENLRGIDTVVMANVCGHTTEEYVEVVKRLADNDVVKLLEINISCPNVTDITELAKACEAGGADGLSLINTLTGMKIDIHKRKFALANKTGGLSGPAVKPVAIRMVYQVRKAVNLPIIGMGGIMTGEDAIEFLMVGATAVSVGTANFNNPAASVEVVKGIEKYMARYEINDINELIGCVE